MTIYLTGVRKTGGHRGRFMPVNNRTTIRVTQTESTQIQLAVFDEDGPPSNLSSSSLALSVAPHSEGLPIITKPGVLAPQLGGNVATFLLEPGDTRPDLVPAGRYAYDVWMTSPAGVRAVLVSASLFVVEVTESRP